MYPYSTAGFQQCCVQCECVCVCVPDSRRGGAATVSHLTQVTPHRKAKCWGLQHFYLAPRKTHTKTERGREGLTHVVKQKFFMNPAKGNMGDTFKGPRNPEASVCFEKMKRQRNWQNSCENLILIARRPQRDVCYSGYMCVCTYCYSHTEKP